ncbi:hypothetical protein G195_011719, partial [Phytophthora kernoviae 00238/432]
MIAEYIQHMCGPTQFIGEIDDGNTKDVTVNIMSGGDKYAEVDVSAGKVVTWKANVADLGGRTLYLDRWRPGFLGLPGTGGASSQVSATIEFTGTTTFGTQKWAGPLVLLGGNDLMVKGSGTLDGQGAWYWKQGQSITRPVFFRLQRVTGSTLSGFTLKNSPFRTFSLVTCQDTTISGLTLDSRAGNGIAKNTDGFDLTKNDHITIINNKIYNQDDCLAMQSSTNTVFSNNYCCGGHGISIGSLGGNTVDESTTVQGLTVNGNTIENSDNGLRIKTIIGLKGLVSNVKYTDNKLSNVKNAIVLHSDYSKSKGGYSGAPTSQVTITDVTVAGLSGTATNLYDVVVNPKVVSDWSFSGVTVSAS